MVRIFEPANLYQMIILDNMHQTGRLPIFTNRAGICKSIFVNLNREYPSWFYIYFHFQHSLRKVWTYTFEAFDFEAFALNYKINIYKQYCFD